MLEGSDTYDMLGSGPILTKEDLIAFERDIVAHFEMGDIKAPVHLAGGNEDALIEIFGHIRPQDWVLCSWRSHYHCLLKGVPAAELKAAILRGRSIALCFPDQRIVSSAIVGGIAPMAVGIATAIKINGDNERVWCFLGDMTARTGIAHEAKQYADGHGLPITWVVEDNGMSVCTDTSESWGMEYRGQMKEVRYHLKEVRYHHKLAWPHVGTGKWVAF